MMNSLLYSKVKTKKKMDSSRRARIFITRQKNLFSYKFVLKIALFHVLRNKHNKRTSIFLVRVVYTVQFYVLNFDLPKMWQTFFCVCQHHKKIPSCSNFYFFMYFVCWSAGLIQIMQGGYFTGVFVFICDAFDFLPGMEVFKSARPENTIYIKVVERPCLTFQIDFLPFMVKSAILCFCFCEK